MPVLANSIAEIPHRHSRVSPSHRPADHARHPVDRPDLLDTGARARMMLDLQRHVGNVAVQRLLAGGAHRVAVQRCGPTPCDCPADQKAAATAGPQEGAVAAGPSVQEEFAEPSR